MLSAFAGGSLFGAACGSAPASVLALHGWGRSHRDFDTVLEGFDAVAVDLPGHGATPAPPHAWSTAEYAEHLVGVLDGMAPRPVVIGHSFGGRVAVRMAAAHPDRVGALILTGVPGLVPSAGRRGPPASYRLARALHRRGLLPEARMEALRRRHGSADYRAASGVMRDVLVRAVNETYEDDLTRLACPVDLVWSDDDDQVPLGVAEAALGRIAQGRLTRCGPGGHLTPLRCAGCLRDALTRSLALRAAAP